MKNLLLLSKGHETINKKRFKFLMENIISVLFLLMLNAGCNDDNSNPLDQSKTTENDTFSLKPISYEEREQIMSAIDDKVAELKNLNYDVQIQTFSSFLSKLPGVINSGIESNSVWGIFADGRPFIVLFNDFDTITYELKSSSSNNFSDIGTIGSLSKTSAIGPGIPNGNTARLLDGYKDGENDNDILEKYLKEKNYSVIKEDATIDAYRRVGGDAVLYIRTHGSIGWANDYKNNDTTTGRPYYALWSITETTSANDILYNEDLNDQNLVYMKIDEEGWVFNKKRSWHYGITKNFIIHYWGRFADGAYVHLSACSSLHPNVKFFRDTIFKQGASLIGGWSNLTRNKWMREAALFVFDRMLGLNQLDGKYKLNPPQRSMGESDSILKEMKTYGIHRITHLVNKSQPREVITEFSFDDRNGSGDRLAPSISYLVTDELNDKLQIYGEFGSDAKSAIVTINSTQAEVYKESTHNLIYCKLTKSGPGSCGDVIVKIRGIESNRVRLSVWKGTFTYTMKCISSGDLCQTWKFDVVLRGDVHDYRLESGKIPQPCEKWVSIIPSLSSGTYTFVGEGQGNSQGDSYRVNWDGNGAIQCQLDGSSDRFFISGEGLKTDANHLWWNFLANKTEGNKETIYRIKDSGYENMGTNQRSYLIPFGRSMFDLPELSMAALPKFMRLSKPADILSDGTIKADSIGPIALTEYDFTTWYITDLIWSHTFKWTTMKPEMGTEIDDQMPR